MKKFKTFEDILQGQEFKTDGLEDHEIAYRQLVLIAKVLNDGWVPDFENYNQYKYEPRFYKQNGAFVYYVYRTWFSYTSVGSRLCFKDRATAEYAVTTFIDIYRRFL
jgi:hypothetical protein